MSGQEILVASGIYNWKPKNNGNKAFLTN